MPLEPKSTQDFRLLEFDEIIDVRSPAEFELDHVDGAVNLPVLSNDERARIGTIYARKSRFTAHRMGAALVARNIAGHLEGHLSGKDGGYRPLLYCWRGGQRSEAFAEVLVRVGWRAETVSGGYRAYRRIVVKELYEDHFAAPVTLLDGNTGTGKTAILGLLASRGVQVLDLEGLAKHRGSVLGRTCRRQPTQKQFESALAFRVAELDPMRPVILEAESSKIGRCTIPPSLWKAMRMAERIEIAAPLDSRARFLVREFSELADDRERLQECIDLLIPFHSPATVEIWRGLATTGELTQLTAQLIEQHYDPRYDRQRKKVARPPAMSILLSEHSAEEIRSAARKIADFVNRMGQSRCQVT